MNCRERELVNITTEMSVNILGENVNVKNVEVACRFASTEH